jgi:hypothetical protein
VSDHSELKRLADTLLAIGHREDFGAWIAALEAFEKASGPEVMLALLAEIQALSEHKQQLVQLREADGFESWAAVLVMVDQLKAEVESLRKDAERYRWLRIADWWRSPVCAISNPKEQAKLGSDCPSGERLDAQIDSAMTKEPRHIAVAGDCRVNLSKEPRHD